MRVVESRCDRCGLAITRATEDAVKAVYETSPSGGPISSTALAGILAITTPTASVMVKRLLAHGVVERSGRQVRLTDHGREHAQAVLRRSRLVETLLIKVLGVPWDEAPAEADLLEHAVSDRLLDRIDDLLGSPSADPHGDPIPQPGADHVEDWGGCLADVEAGVPFRVERVRHDDPAALTYLRARGLVPGAVCTVVHRAPFEGPVTLVLASGRQEVGRGALVHVFGRALAHDDTTTGS